MVSTGIVQTTRSPSEQEYLLLDYWGLRLRVMSNSVSALDVLCADGPRFVVPGNGADAQAHISIMHREYGAPSQLPDAWQAAARRSDPKLLIDPRTGQLLLLASRSRSADALRSLVQRVVMLHYSARGFHFLHGSVATSGERSLAVVGEKGSGKTSFVLALVGRHGWKLVCEDVMMIGKQHGKVVVYGLHASVNLDGKYASPEGYLAACQTHGATVYYWRLRPQEKRRHFLPQDVLAAQAPLTHIVFSTLHPLCPSPTSVLLPASAVCQFGELCRYATPTLPDVRFPDAGLRSEDDGLSVLTEARGLLFLGSMDLSANVRHLLDVLDSDEEKR